MLTTCLSSQVKSFNFKSNRLTMFVGVLRGFRLNSRLCLRLDASNFVNSVKNLSSLANSSSKLKDILHKAFPSAKSIDVTDISGGCGAMYEISVEAPQFKGLTTVKQHQLVTKALEEEIKEMHGIRIHTSPS